MNTTASRFAVLKIYDDEDAKAAQRAANKLKTINAQSVQKKATTEKDKIVNEKKAAKKKKSAAEKKELVALAFGGSKPKKSNSTKKGSDSNAGKSEDSLLSADWQKRDKEFVQGTYEDELKQALIASKVEYEENKDLYEAKKEDKEASVVNTRKKQGNKKGTTTMTLDQFNVVPQQSSKTDLKPPKSNEVLLAADNFFYDITEEAAKLIEKEKKLAELQKKKKCPIKPIPEDQAPRLAQLQDEFNKCSEELEKYRLENEKLREELMNVKTRNKRLCNILMQGEMKEKAELLVQMEKLNKVKDELTNEVDSLATQLQQERSKVSALNDVKKVSGSKK